VTARAVARLLAALVTGVDGVRLVGPDQLAELSSVVASGQDQVFGFAGDAWGLGHIIGHPVDAGRSTVFRNDGAGGSSVWADTATGVVVAVTKNRMTQSDDTVAAVARAVEG
jgi:CubicO group peptidase (beta-lactamase class C family)